MELLLHFGQPEMSAKHRYSIISKQYHIDNTLSLWEIPFFFSNQSRSPFSLLYFAKFLFCFVLFSFILFVSPPHFSFYFWLHCDDDKFLPAQTVSQWEKWKIVKNMKFSTKLASNDSSPVSFGRAVVAGSRWITFFSKIFAQLRIHPRAITSNTL